MKPHLYQPFYLMVVLQDLIQKWTRYKPDLSRLQICGSLAYAKISRIEATIRKKKWKTYTTIHCLWTGEKSTMGWKIIISIGVIVEITKVRTVMATDRKQ